VIPGEHRRKHRHDGELDDERRQKELVGREEAGALEHSGHFTLRPAWI
jgi:hypothetical protein